MAYYAIISENNVVVDVIPGRDENDLPEGVTSWEDYFTAKGRGRAIRTSYNTFGGIHYDPQTGEPSADQTKAFRGNYAGIGYTYDELLDAFISPRPFPSWLIDTATFSWVAPVPMPEDGGDYTWDEEAGDWVTADE